MNYAGWWVGRSKYRVALAGVVNRSRSLETIDSQPDGSIVAVRLLACRRKWRQANWISLHMDSRRVVHYIRVMRCGYTERKRRHSSFGWNNAAAKLKPGTATE